MPMLNKKVNINQRNTVLLVYVIILSLLGPLIVVMSNHNGSLSTAIKTKLANSSQSNQRKSLQTRLSIGERLLITADNNPHKQAAIQAFAVGDYTSATNRFQESLKINPNDPETLIYLNNAQAAIQGKSFKIAASLPIGANLDVAKEILRGIAQTQNEINQSGGIDGKLIQVELANDDNNPELAKQIAEEFVKDQRILAVIGHNSSNASLAAAPIYQQQGLVMITPTSSAEGLSAIGNYIFRATPSTRAIADTLALYAVNSARMSNIAICADSEEEASKSFKEEFTWAIYYLGGKIAPTICDFSDPDFHSSEIPSRAISDGTDALLLAPAISNVDRAIEIAQANKGRLPLLGNHSMNTYTTLHQGQKEVNGMVLTVAWHPQLNSDNAFAANSHKLWGGTVNWRTAMAYDATKAAIASLKSAATRQQVQKALANPGFSIKGANETIKFLPSGDRNMKGTLVKIEPGKKSGTGYDFVFFKSSLLRR